MSKNVGVVRGCGSRVPGGVYWEVPTSRFGQPIEYFLTDPPVALYPERIGITAVGVHMIETTNGQRHLIDIIGRKYYRNVLDFIEEAKRFGISRRVSSNVDFSAIGADVSKLIVAHARAIITNPNGHHYDRHFPGCPCGITGHPPTDGHTCVGCYWNDIEDGVEVSSHDPRLVEVSMPSFKYRAFLSPPGTHSYQLGIFATFPLGRWVVINDPEGKKHRKAIERIEKAGHEAHLEDA